MAKDSERGPEVPELAVYIQAAVKVSDLEASLKEAKRDLREANKKLLRGTQRALPGV